MGRAVIAVSSHAKHEIMDITDKIQRVVEKLGIDHGAILVFCPHTTAAVTLSEAADPDVRTDVGRAFSALVPNVPFQHAEGNSPAHFLSALIGPSLILPVEGGELRLGTWQGVYFCEFDGPRSRSVWVYPLAMHP